MIQKSNVRHVVKKINITFLMLELFFRLAKRNDYIEIRRRKNCRKTEKRDPWYVKYIRFKQCPILYS